MSETIDLERVRELARNVVAIPLDEGQVRTVVVARWVPPDQALIFGDFPRPDGWEKMSEPDRIEYAVRHGAVVVLHGED